MTEITNDKQTIKFISFSDLIDMNLESADCQRPLDEEHINTIIEYQNAYFNENKSYDFVMSISLGKINDKMWIIDGQHRYSVIKQLSYPGIISVNIIECKDTGELNSRYEMLNKNKQVILFQNLGDNELVNKVVIRLKKNYKQYFSQSLIPQSPNINEDNLLKALNNADIVKQLDIKSVDQLYNYIEEINTFYKNNTKLFDKWNLKLSERTTTKLDDVKPALYLGIYRKFEWIDFLIQYVKNKIPLAKIKHIYLENKRAPITSVMKTKIWAKQYILAEDLCFICKETKISSHTCVYAHIVAHALGGLSTIDNLEAICSDCNSDMRIENLWEYKKRKELIF